jgi:hypothetical protein
MAVAAGIREPGGYTLKSCASQKGESFNDVAA